MDGTTPDATTESETMNTAERIEKKAERERTIAARMREMAAQVRIMLTDSDRSEFATAPNRTTARRIAQRNQWSVAATWTALSGKKWQR